MTGKRIAILGLAFKKDTNDTRESAAIDVCRDLLLEEAKVEADHIRRDLLAVGVTEDLLDCNLEINGSVEGAAASAHGLAILTEWDSFRDLGWPAIHGGMNLLDHKSLRALGFQVYAIGKGQERN